MPEYSESNFETDKHKFCNQLHNHTQNDQSEEEAESLFLEHIGVTNPVGDHNWAPADFDWLQELDFISSHSVG